MKILSRSTRRIQNKLRPDFGSLTVTSAPQSGLDIYLNGQNQNIKTPHTFDRLKPGKYRVAARAKLYETPEQNIEIRRAGKHSINLTSEGNFAVLNIKTLAGARVYLNGQPVTELTGIRLEPQIARVKADLPPKAKPVEKRITLKKGQTLDLDIFPEIPTGTIQVAVVPFEAKIELKGDAGEFYTASQSKSFRDIPTGRYQLKVSQKGYKTFRKDVLLTEGEVVKERVTLDIKARNDQFGTVLIDAVPRADQVFIDGVLHKGPTPARVSLKSGPHTIRLVNARLKVSHEQKINLKIGQVLRVKHDFTQKEVGRVAIELKNARQYGFGYVYVDGKPWPQKHNTTPLEIKLPVGSHTIEVKRDGFNSVPKDVIVKVEKDQTKYVSFVFLKVQP